MTQVIERPRSVRSPVFDAGMCAVGLALGIWSVLDIVDSGWDLPTSALLAVPLIVVIGRFPIVIDKGEGSIEVGFDSAVLMLLACLLPPSQALLLWSLGTLAQQSTSLRRRPQAAFFNIGVGIIAGALAIAVLQVVRGPEVSGLRELLAVVLAATVYFVTDFVVSGVSLSLSHGTSLVDLLRQRDTWLALVCFVPFDLLGYLGAIVQRSGPWWTLILLAVPLATLLVAARAISHGRENARRLQVLLDAAVDSHTLSEPHQVVESLVVDARRLLRLDDVVVRDDPPSSSEVGTQVRGGGQAMWVVAPARMRARSTRQADQQALTALAAVSRAAFSRLALTEDLVHIARFDPLTDLPNRAVFLDRLNYALLLARRRKRRVALLFIDLDGFKPVNDRFGHAAGDAVLIEVARRLQSTTREEDTVARLGGDEFAVLLDEIEPEQVDVACRRILAALSDAVEAAGHVVHVSASIGISHWSGREHADEMLRNADLAMYEAKAGGKNRYVVYEPTMLTSRLGRLELVEALQAAITGQDITVVYQPVIVAETGRITGVEALARWDNAGVDVRPEVFIKLAEQTGLINELGASVLATVARDAAAIVEAAEGDVKVGLNVSPSQLADPGFADNVRSAVDTIGSSGLVLEITEREGISHDPVVLQTMQRVTEMGVIFAIDDFGVGFSSISYLQEVSARIVKIDASLSQNIDRDEQARGLLVSITMMSQALGLDVVIEGIERDSQLAVVRHDVAGAYVQGYLVHRPMRLPDLLDTLRANREAELTAPPLLPTARAELSPVIAVLPSQSESTAPVF